MIVTVKLQSDDVSKLFKKVKVNNSLACNSPMEIPYYSSGLFEDICFQCRKIPENEESDNVEEKYYYCNEYYITVFGKKKKA